MKNKRNSLLCMNNIQTTRNKYKVYDKYDTNHNTIKRNKQHNIIFPIVTTKKNYITKTDNIHISRNHIEKDIKKRSQSVFVHGNYFINYKKFYSCSETEMLIKNYSSDITKFCRKIQQYYLIPKHYLYKHEISSNYRTKIVEWIMEVFFTYKNNSPTFLLCVQIMDKFFLHSKTIIKEKDIHLIAVVSIFIASKLVDKTPFHIKTIVENISRNKYSESNIKEQEIQILKYLKFDIFPLTINDFITLFLSDLEITNKVQINKFNLKIHLKTLAELSLFFARIMTLDEIFNSYLLIDKAVTCIVFGFEILRIKSKCLMPQQEEYLNYWMIAISNSKYVNIKEVMDAYCRIREMFNYIKQFKKIELFHIYKFYSIDLS